MSMCGGGGNGCEGHGAMGVCVKIMKIMMMMVMTGQSRAGQGRAGQTDEGGDRVTSSDASQCSNAECCFDKAQGMLLVLLDWCWG